MGESTRQYDFDYIVVGSGFGGSVSALRLSEKGYRVAVMEMGRRWTPDNLPKTSWSLHRWFWRPSLALRGFFSMRYFRHVTILHGCAVGGGSITYACTMLRPPDKVWDNGSWKGLGRLESRDAAALRHRIAHAGRRGEPHPWPGGQAIATSVQRSWHWKYVLSHQRRDSSVAGRNARRYDDSRSRTSAAKARSAPPAKVAAAA